jgi:hypothetical protein
MVYCGGPFSSPFSCATVGCRNRSTTRWYCCEPNRQASPPRSARRNEEMDLAQRGRRVHCRAGDTPGAEANSTYARVQSAVFPAPLVGCPCVRGLAHERRIWVCAFHGIEAAIADVGDDPCGQSCAKLRAVSVSERVIHDCPCQAVVVDQDECVANRGR